MRSIHAGLAILWLGLAAVAPAESLPPEDIPIQCARICGPVVELTSQCSPRRVIRRSGPDQESVAGESYVHVGAPQRRHRRRGEDVDGHLEKRVLVIVAVPNGPGPGPPVTISRTKTGQTDQPAPTSSLPPSRTSILSPILTSEPTRASSQTSTQPTRATPQTSTPQSVRTLSTLDSPSLSALAPSKTRGTTPADDGVQLGTAVNSSPLGAEEECVCSNQSFNVSEVAALCSSCIMQSGDDMNSRQPLPRIPQGRYRRPRAVLTHCRRGNNHVNLQLLARVVRGRQREQCPEHSRLSDASHGGGECESGDASGEPGRCLENLVLGDGHGHARLGLLALTHVGLLGVGIVMTVMGTNTLWTRAVRHGCDMLHVYRVGDEGSRDSAARRPAYHAGAPRVTALGQLSAYLVNE